MIIAFGPLLFPSASNLKTLKALEILPFEWWWARNKILQYEAHPMFVPLGKAPYTPWQRIRSWLSSAKGIRADSVRVVYIKESRSRLLEPPL